MRCVIPHAAEQQGMPVYTHHQKIAMSSLRVFYDCLYFVPFDKFRGQRYAFLTRRLLCLGLKVSIVLRSLLPQQCSPAWHFGRWMPVSSARPDAGDSSYATRIRLNIIFSSLSQRANTE